MQINKTFLAVIPARGGSKRLPRKNVLNLNGRPLIAWSIEAGVRSKYVSQVIVSSDSPEILDVSRRFGALTIKRPAELATDTALTIDVLNHVLERCALYDYIVVLQPTSPLRNEKHIDAAIELLLEKKADAVVSVCNVDHSPLWSNTLPADGSMLGFIRGDIQNTRSQDLGAYYRLNGALYICETKRLIEEQSLMLKDNIFAYKMAREVSVDIDTKQDFLYTEFLLHNGTSAVSI